MIDKQLTNFIERNQNWILNKCRYFTENTQKAKELRGKVYLDCWEYKDNFTGDPSDDRIKAWLFFVIKYAWFHTLKDQELYNLKKLNSLDYISYKPSENLVLRTLEAEREINSILRKVKINLSKTHANVLKLYAEGYKTKEIGKKLVLKDTYIRNVKKQNEIFMRGDKIKERLSRRKETNKIPIIAYKMDGDRNILEEHKFKTPTEAASKLNIKSKSGVFRALENEDYTAEGWFFKRKETK